MWLSGGWVVVGVRSGSKRRDMRKSALKFRRCLFLSPSDGVRKDPMRELIASSGYGVLARSVARSVGLLGVTTEKKSAPNTQD